MGNEFNAGQVGYMEALKEKYNSDEFRPTMTEEDVQLLEDYNLLTQSSPQLDPELTAIVDKASKLKGHSPDPGFFESLFNSAGAIATGTGAEIMALKKGVKGIPRLGAIVGGASMAGEGLQQLWQHMFGSELAPQTTTEAMKRMGGEGILGTTGPIVGKGVTNLATWGTKKLGRSVDNLRIPFTNMKPIKAARHKLMNPGGRRLTQENRELVRAAEKVKFPLSAWEINRLPFVGRMESFAQNGIISSRTMNNFANARRRAIQGFKESLTNVPGGIPKSHEALGEMLLTQVEMSLQMSSKTLAKQFGIKNLDQITDKEFATLLEDALIHQAGGGSSGIGNVLRNNPEMVEPLLKTMREQSQIRSTLLGLKAQLGLGKKTTSDFIRAFNATSGKEGLIFKRIFSPGNSQKLKILRNMIGPDEWPLYQKAFVENLIGGKNFNLAGLGQVLDEYGEETLKAVLEEPILQGLRDLALIGARTGIQDLSKVGARRLQFNLVNIVEGGLAVNLVTQSVGKMGVGAQGGHIVALLAPSAIAKLVTTPGGVQYLTTGLKMSAKAKQTAEVAKNIIKGTITTSVSLGTRSTATQLTDPTITPSASSTATP